MSRCILNTFENSPPSHLPGVLSLSLCLQTQWRTILRSQIVDFLPINLHKSSFKMEGEGTEGMAKRMKSSVEDKEIAMEDGSLVQIPAEENVVTSNSEQVEMEISHILEKIESFTQMVSELLESGKSTLKELSNEFEERMILIHKEQMEKWQEEIKELRLLDTANEEMDAVLHNAAYLLKNITGES